MKGKRSNRRKKQNRNRIKGVAFPLQLLDEETMRSLEMNRAEARHRFANFKNGNLGLLLFHNRGQTHSFNMPGPKIC